MGVDVFALVTAWEPAVAAYRAADGLDFYWDANVARNQRFLAGDESDDLPELPFLTEVELPGGRSSYLCAGEYYDFLRPHLPTPMRAAADATFGLLLPHLGPEWAPPRHDDLAADAGIEPSANVLYALRPESVRDVLAGQPPWEEVLAIAERYPVRPEPEPNYANEDTFQLTAWQHLATLASASADGRGVVTVISY
ncbi:hypothetical protein [Labedaea rhizosphaerae]|uniref:DUF1877 family protein n=1 Tax=Labedaea rhizosphaerae TaxID=598644 RepID=A0A4V3CY53_LABRH|nr:hypothetical protein [Labedaea rhizosphaerae]TDP92818.1 hypothetical protein EV186_10733 [Labedaea rhizosphaerae]